MAAGSSPGSRRPGRPEGRAARSRSTRTAGRCRAHRRPRRRRPGSRARGAGQAGLEQAAVAVVEGQQDRPGGQRPPAVHGLEHVVHGHRAHGPGQVAELAAEGCRVVDAVVGEHGEAPDRLEHEGHPQRGPAQGAVRASPGSARPPPGHVSRHGHARPKYIQPDRPERQPAAEATALADRRRVCPACSLRLSTRISLVRILHLIATGQRRARGRLGPDRRPTRLTWTSGSRCCTATRHGPSGSAPVTALGPGGAAAPGRPGPAPAAAVVAARPGPGARGRAAEVRRPGRHGPTRTDRLPADRLGVVVVQRTPPGAVRPAGAARRPGGGGRRGRSTTRPWPRSGWARPGGDHPQRGRPGPAGPDRAGRRPGPPWGSPRTPSRCCRWAR